MAIDLKGMNSEMLLDRFVSEVLCINLGIGNNQDRYLCIRTEVLRRFNLSCELQGLIDEVIDWEKDIDRKPMNELPWSLAKKLYDTQERLKDEQ